MTLVTLCALLCLATLPLGEFHLLNVGINLSPPNIAGLAFTVVTGIFFVSNPKQLRTLPIPPLLFMGGYSALIIVGNFHHLPPTKALSASTPCIGSGLMFLVGLIATSSTNSPTKWASVILISATLCFIIGLGHVAKIIPYFEPYPTWASNKPFELFGNTYHGATGLMKSRGNYGIFGLLGLIAALRNLPPSTSIQRRAIFISITIIAAGLFLSLSRSTWLAVIIFALCLAALRIRQAHNNPGKTPDKILVILLITIVGATLSSLIFHQQLATFIQSARNISPESITIRMNSYRAALDAIALHPAFGLGPKFEHAVLNIVHIVHNTFLRSAATYGIHVALALAALIIFIYLKLFKTLKTTQKHEDRTHLILWIAGLTGAMVEMNLFSGEYSKPFWAMLGLAAGEAYRISRQKLNVEHG